MNAKERIAKIRSAATAPALVEYVKSVREDRLKQKLDSQNIQPAVADTPSVEAVQYFKQLQKQEKERLTMANPNQNNGQKNNGQKNGGAAKSDAPAAKEGMSAAAAKADPAKSKKGEKIRVRSQVNPDYTFRVVAADVAKWGMPEHGGKPMVPSEKRSGLKEYQEAEKAKLDSMSEEERTAYTKKQREEKKAAKTAKKAQERAALVEQLKKEIAEGKV